jgi:ATP-binding cassette subfamily B protein
MLKRFIKYYRPHRGLFCLTMTAAVAGAGMTVLIPAVTRRLLDECIPNDDLAGIIQNLGLMLILIILTTASGPNSSVIFRNSVLTTSIMSKPGT